MDTPEKEITTKTPFYKTLAFKCIIVLLSIALICSGLLAILNDVLFVTSEERTARAIKKIYGEEKQYTEFLLSKDVDVSEFGNIDVVYKIDNGSSYDLLIKVTGNEGYKNGTITLWVQTNIKDDSAKIEKVVLESYEKQTLMSKLSQSYYDSFDYIDGYYSSNNSGEKNIVSGATYSSNACCNAVNCAIKYIKEGVLSNEK